MRVTEYLKELIKNGSGHSSKSFFLVAVTLMGCFLLLIVGFVLVYEVIVNKSIKTDLMGYRHLSVLSPLCLLRLELPNV